MVIVMRTKKKLWIIAYDIANNKRRRRIVKIIEKYGKRANFSVFECMLTEYQLIHTKTKISKILDATEDKIIFYPICLNCYSKVEYIPSTTTKTNTVKII